MSEVFSFLLFSEIVSHLFVICLALHHTVTWVHLLTDRAMTTIRTTSLSLFLMDPMTINKHIGTDPERGGSLPLEKV